jgi:hypothetical protein
MKDYLVLVALTSLVASGCKTNPQKQLERVAKDWSLTMRASQIIPVYPLTEDLKPGDVFLVQTPIQDQVQIYNAKGFLPFDNHIARLQSEEFANFYAKAHGTDGKTPVPYLWSTPLAETNAWKHAPNAAFPSYSFEVDRGGGLSVALPIQGVPVGLSLLGADRAYGSITIKDAYTYGLTEEELDGQVVNWALLHQEFLSYYPPSPVGTNYLRVVHRVYLASEMRVFLSKAGAFGASASGGAPKDVNLFELNNTNSVENYTNIIQKLNDSIASAAAPGGSIKIASASSRSISMNETFNRPLVIGYLAFEYPILSEGGLGPAVSTFSRLSNQNIIKSPHTNVLTFAYDTKDPNADLLMAWLRKKDPTTGELVNQKALINWMRQNGKKEFTKRQIPSIATSPEERDIRQQIVNELIKK